MKIVFISGFLNNHLLPICESLNKRSDFTFIATEKRDGLSLANREVIECDYVIHDYIDAEEPKCIEAVRRADIVILGGSSGKYLTLRKAIGGLAFIYSERVFKRGRFHRFYPPTRRVLKKTFIENNDNVYILCASSYLCGDIKLLGFPSNKCFRFGYFPKIRHLPFENILDSKTIDDGSTVQLLYVGRLLKLKRVGMLLKMCEKLSSVDVKYELNIIGDGPEMSALKTETLRLGLNSVIFHGAMPIDCVYDYMKRSNILYLPSNHLEGWGAVVNEALGFGCVVIEADSCGSARYLIEEDKNGYIYKGESVKDLFDSTMKYINAGDKAVMHRCAYDTVWDKWNSDLAADRLISISESLLSFESFPRFIDGPLSMD